MPQPLGLETKGGVFTVLITRGTALPTRRSDVFTTADEYQGSITITLFQGDHGQAALNTRLGVFELTGFTPDRAGLPQIQVTLDVDFAVLTVSANDLRSGAELPVTVSGASPPSPTW